MKEWRTGHVPDCRRIVLSAMSRPCEVAAEENRTATVSGVHAVAFLWLFASVLASLVTPTWALQPNVVATYRVAGERHAIDAEELESWLEHGFVGQADEIDRAEALRQLILTKSLGQDAERLARHEEPATAVEIAMAKGRLALTELRRHVSSSISITDQAADQKYRQIKDTYTLPRRVRLRNLFKRFPLNATEADKAALRQEMSRLRERVLEGEDFASLAERESDSQTRFLGGLIGNVRAGSLRGDIDQVAMVMKAGELSEILEGPTGYTLLYCEKILDAVERSEAELREIARNLLSQKEWRSRWAATEADLLEQVRAVWHWPSIDSSREVPLVSYRDGQLSVEDVLAVVSPRAARMASDRESAKRRLTTMGRERVERRMEPFFKSLAAVDVVRSEGLWTAELDEQATWTRWRVLAAASLAARVQERLEPATEAELREFFSANPEDFRRPEQHHLGVVTLEFDPADPRPRLEQGLRLTDELEAGVKTFAEVAREHSSHASAADGGDLGWVPRPALVNRLGIDGVRALRKLNPGERSKWIQDDERSHFLLIELRGVERERPYTFEEARDQARQLHGQRRAQEIQRVLSADWWRALDVTTTDESSG